MAKTVAALYDDFDSANDAVRQLLDNSFLSEDISLIANDQTGQYSRSLDTREKVSSTSEGAVVGAGVGAVIGGLGGLLVGLGALVIPGIGPVIAAGPLAAGLSSLAGAGIGAVAGGVAGGLLGGLVNMGIPEESAGYYAEGVRRGGTLVTIRTSDERANQAVEILNRYNPVDINRRVSEWRQTGWSRFDPDGSPFPMTTEESEFPRDTYSTQTRQYSDFDTYRPHFRNHYDNYYMGSEYSFDQYLPAYRYGYDLAIDKRYRDYDWNTLEPEAQRNWDERNPGTWERFKDAVRDAWQEIKDEV